MKRLSLGVRLYATDLTACFRCGNSVRLQDSWPLHGGGRICPDCVAEAVEAHRLTEATNHATPS